LGFELALLQVVHRDFNEGASSVAVVLVASLAVYPCRAVAGICSLLHLLEQFAVLFEDRKRLGEVRQLEIRRLSSARTLRRTDSICCCENIASRFAISPFKRNLPGYGMSCETPKPM